MSNPQKLKKRVIRNREERVRDLAKTKPYQDRMREISDAAELHRTSFWCDECEADFDALGAKSVRHKSGEMPSARYWARCPEGHMCWRYITDKHQDGYYFKSLIVRRQRAELADAFLQPSDPRFRLVYPKEWRKMEEEREAAEMADDLEPKL